MVYMSLYFKKQQHKQEFIMFQKGLITKMLLVTFPPALNRSTCKYFNKFPPQKGQVMKSTTISKNKRTIKTIITNFRGLHL